MSDDLQSAQELYCEALDASGKISAERLRSLLHYDSKTGVFTRRITTPGKNRAAGSIVGNDNGDGYLRTVIDGRRYRLHRLAWLYMTGEWPPEGIDHIDGSKMNNAFANLRPASPALNMQNQRHARADNKSSLLGATWHKQPGKWRARITIDGKQHHLGHFKTADEAHIAYVQAKRAMHAGCTL